MSKDFKKHTSLSLLTAEKDVSFIGLVPAGLQRTILIYLFSETIKRARERESFICSN